MRIAASMHAYRMALLHLPSACPSTVLLYSVVCHESLELAGMHIWQHTFGVSELVLLAITFALCLVQVGEHADLAKPAEIMVGNIFNGWKLSAVSELSLSANQLQSDLQRLKWHPGRSLSGSTEEETPRFEQQPAVMCNKQQCLESLKVIVNPMEVKTLLLELA